jgi:hypothetical protein
MEFTHHLIKIEYVTIYSFKVLQRNSVKKKVCSVIAIAIVSERSGENLIVRTGFP